MPKQYSEGNPDRLSDQRHQTSIIEVMAGVGISQQTPTPLRPNDTPQRDADEHNQQDAYNNIENHIEYNATAQEETVMFSKVPHPLSAWKVNVHGRGAGMKQLHEWVELQC